MNYDNLVDLIVSEIYKKIQQQELTTENKKKAVLLWDEDTKKYEGILGGDYRLVTYNEDIKECEAIVVSKLCLRGLANIASGMSVSNEERFILKMLMMGKKVYIIEEGIEYRRYKNTAPAVLYSKYVAFEEDIKKFGAEVIAVNGKVREEKAVVIENKSVKEEIALDEVILGDTEEGILHIRNKKLITESDLRKPFMNGMKTVIVDKKSLITPLATDFIRIHHLKLKKV